MEEGDFIPKQYPNVPPILGLLVSRRICSLNELRTIYSLADAYWMYEAIMVPQYNLWKEQKAQETRHKK